MPRPRICRRIFFEPKITYFKPAGIPLRTLQETILAKDEIEAVRLIDFQNISQKQAAKKMKVSQPTLSRLLTSARKKLSEAIVKGKAIKIQGGNFKMMQQPKISMGLGRGRMGGQFAAGPGGICKCPKCGYEEPQIRGQPCMNKKCPKCRTPMIRKV
jgi:predicted DNA-binding protein (UPF0251 family)